MTTLKPRNGLIIHESEDINVPYNLNTNMDIIDAALAKCNFAAATDPGVGDDSADGYAAGSVWHNTTAGRKWVCKVATAGAAVWWQAPIAGVAFDFGAVEVRALSFQSDIDTGAGAPFVVASAAKVTNLNADLLDDREGAAYAVLAGQAGGQRILIDKATATDNGSPGIVGLANDDFLYDSVYINHYGFGFWGGDIKAYVAGYCGIQFFTAGLPRVRIHENGCVGIGTITPTVKLQLGISVENQIDNIIRVGNYLDLTSAYYGGGHYICGNSRLSTSSASVNKFVPVYNAGYGIVMKLDFSNNMSWYGINWGSSNAEKDISSDFAQIMYITYDGNLWVAGDVNCASVTDHTPAYEGNALAELERVVAKDGKIDHAKLPEFCQKEYIDQDGRPQIGRDIGGMVSVLTVGIQQLKEFYESAVAERDKKISELAARLEKLEAASKV